MYTHIALAAGYLIRLLSKRLADGNDAMAAKRPMFKHSFPVGAMLPDVENARKFRQAIDFLWPDITGNDDRPAICAPALLRDTVTRTDESMGVDGSFAFVDELSTRCQELRSTNFRQQVKAAVDECRHGRLASLAENICELK